MTRKSLAAALKPSVPINPEDIDEYVERGRKVLQRYVNETGCDPDTALGDLLSNLMHLCDSATGWGTFNAGLKNGKMHYRDEVLSR